MSVRADRERLTDVLRQLARAGVRIRIDPRVESRVSARFVNENVDQALDALLEPFGYVLIWDVIEGPLGPLRKLDEVQVFLPGRKKKVEPLPGIDPNFAVASGFDGKAPRFVQDEILLGFKPGTSGDQFEILLSQIGGTLIDSVPGLGVYLVRLAPRSNVPALVEQLAKNPIVARVEPNYIVDVPEPVLGLAAGEKAARAGAPEPGRGAVPVAILDSGLSPESGLGKAVVGRYDAIDPKRPLADALGHGTQMALLAAGAVLPDESAPDDGLPVVAVRAFDDNGLASSFSLMRSIRYALSQGAKVLNMSWGSEADSEFLQAAVQRAREQGALVVAAAGNEPTGKPLYPAAYPGVIAVSALGANGRAWEQSNFGDFVWLAAPGTASFPVGYKGPPGAYAGTSIASAYTARALALYWSKHPSASGSEVLRVFKESLTDAGAPGRDPQYGHGILDAAALKRLGL